MYFLLALINIRLQSMNFDIDLNFLTSIWPVYFIPCGIVILYLIMNPEKAELWGSILSRLIAFFSRKAERRSVSGDIQGRLNSFVKKYQADDVLPYGLRFKWVTNSNFESFVQNGEVVVIMNNHQNNARNFLNALIAWTDQGLLPQVKNFIPNEIMQATELTLQEKIIQSQRSDALKIFRDEILPTRLNNFSGTAKYKDKLSNLDRTGYFDTIYLSELAFAGGRLQDLLLNEVMTELNSFIEFLERLADRDPIDDTTPLSIKNTVFKVSVVIVAKSFIILTRGIGPYVNRIKNAFTEKQDSIYVLIRKPNFTFVDSLIGKVEEESNTKKIWKKEILMMARKIGKSNAIMCLFR